jgi:N-acetylglucosaminyl-diphospho-decaprenol L-rhamnosyltransferase
MMHVPPPSQSSHGSSSQVTTIMVTYNSAHCLETQAIALRQHTYLMIVDNASQDDTVSMTQQYLPAAELIVLPVNKGFGAANNIALQKVQTPFALLLNPDCTIEPRDIAQLLAAAEQFPQAAILAPQVKRPTGQLELSYRWPSRYWVSKGAAAEAPCCVGFVTGACLLLRMSHFERIGFFDESFFLYYEDEDLCERVFQTQNNILLVPQAIATHAARGSVKEGFPWRAEYMRGFHHAQSKLIFEGKHRQEPRVLGLRWKVLVLALLTLPLRLLALQPKYLVRLLGRIAGLLSFRAR